MTYNLFPSFKAIRYFERMTKTSFLELENNPDLLPQLLYCCLLAHPENKFRLTFEDTIQSFFPDNIDQLVELFSNEMKIINQFNQEMNEELNDSSIDGTDTSSPAKEEKVYMSSLIPILIYNCHLDADFVLNEFDYTDTKLYLESSVERHHEEMEDKRFWTYLTIAPHLSSKAKIKEAKDLVEFTWEKEQKKEDAEKKMVSDRDKLIELGIIKVEEHENESLTETEN